MSKVGDDFAPHVIRDSAVESGGAKKNTVMESPLPKSVETRLLLKGIIIIDTFHLPNVAMQ